MEEVVNMKEKIFKRYLQKRLTRDETAKLLNLHPGSVSRLASRYKKEGKEALYPRKPGPKSYNIVHNKTPSFIEDFVVKIAQNNLDKGPMWISERLEQVRGICLHETTIYRILKRRKVRYAHKYRRWINRKPKLYCLEKPGIELQLDASYPFGRQRNIVSFDAIDDCSRFVIAKLYDRENDENAIEFVKYLVKKAPFQIRSLRVDNRYGVRFKKYCESIGIDVIKNDPYHPEQNGKIERFHRTMKNEFFYKFISFYDTMEKIEYKYQQWLFHYNTQRRHGGYGMNRMTPKQKIASTLFLSLNNINFTPQKVTSTMQQYM